jgi:hypothetical protein
VHKRQNEEIVRGKANNVCVISLLPNAPFFQLNSNTTINGVVIPTGTYTKEATMAQIIIKRRFI